VRVQITKKLAIKLVGASMMPYSGTAPTSKEMSHEFAKALRHVQDGQAQEFYCLRSGAKLKVVDRGLSCESFFIDGYLDDGRDVRIPLEGVGAFWRATV
jgi:hypothetical protein